MVRESGGGCEEHIADELKLKLPHSEVELRAEMASFESNDWDLRYRGNLALEDVRTILRKPTTPEIGAFTVV